jgi:hypothetical protein
MGADWQQIRPFLQGGCPMGHEKGILAATFLDFSRLAAFNPAQFIGKTFFSTRRPACETGGQRPTALCALGRKVVWNTAVAA